LCGLNYQQGACFDFSIHKCLGACIGKESADTYNQRAIQAIESFEGEKESYFIIDKGKHIRERSVVSINNGKYYGFGFIDIDTFNGDLEALSQCIEHKSDNRDIQLIIKQFIKKNKVEKIIPYYS